MFVKKNDILEKNFELEGKYFLIIKLTNKFMQHGRKIIMERILLEIRIHIKNV